MSSDKKNLTYQSIGALLRVQLDKRGLLLDIGPSDAGHLAGVRWHRIQLVDLWSFLDLKKQHRLLKHPCWYQKSAQCPYETYTRLYTFQIL